MAKKELLILGAASHGAAHAKKWLMVHPMAKVCCINRMIYLWDGLCDIGSTLHWPMLSEWLAKRQSRGRDVPATLWTDKEFPYDRDRDVSIVGTSALFSIHVARLMGYDLVHLAGVTIDDGYSYARPGWVQAREEGLLDCLGEILTDGWLQRWMQS